MWFPLPNYKMQLARELCWPEDWQVSASSRQKSDTREGRLSNSSTGPSSALSSSGAMRPLEQRQALGMSLGLPSFQPVKLHHPFYRCSHWRVLLQSFWDRGGFCAQNPADEGLQRTSLRGLIAWLITKQGTRSWAKTVLMALEFLTQDRKIISYFTCNSFATLARAVRKL